MSSQAEFDKVYVTSPELRRKLGVDKAMVTHAVRDGKLPQPVRVEGSGSFLWPRAEVQPYVDRWLAGKVRAS